MQNRTWCPEVMNMTSMATYAVFPLHLKSRGFRKGWWYPKHNKNIDNNIENVGVHSEIWGRNPYFLEIFGVQTMILGLCGNAETLTACHGQ